MDKIDVGAPFAGERRDRFFARSVGTSFDIRASSTGGTDIDLYDEIGYYGVDAKGFRATLKEAHGDITLRMNSGGGDVFDGISIYNDLLAYDGNVRVEITGIAASIASIIAMAGTEIVMAENAMIMIHDSWTIAAGNRHDFGDVAGVLSKIDDAMARTYASRTKGGIKQIKTWMDNETWFSAKDAVEHGFATSIVPGGTAKAKFDLSVFSAVPKSLLWNDDDVPLKTEEDVEKILMRDAGKTRSQARALIKDIRAGKTSTPEPLQDAGGVDLTAIADALKSARSVIHTQ